MKPKLLLCLALVLGGHCQAAIIRPPGPEGGRQMASNYAAAMLRSNPRFLSGFRLEELNIVEPFRNYGVGLTNVGSGQLLPAAKPGQWQYLLLHGTNAAGVVTLIADDQSGQTVKPAGLFQTDFSSETLDALRIAEQLPQVKKQDYELRRLDIPGIHFVAVWLHGKTDDIIIPLPPTFGRWNAYQSFSEGEMMKLLKPEAEKVLKQPSTSSTPTFLQNILRKIPQQLPELASTHITAGTTSPGEVLNGEEYAAGGFYLAKHPRPLPGAPPGTFYADLDATIHRYASDDDAQKDLEDSLGTRAAPPEPKGNYKGAALYRSTSGGGLALCRSGRYVVEIRGLSENGGPLVMQVLDVILAELDSASTQPKQP